MHPIYFHPYELKSKAPPNARVARTGLQGVLLRQGDGFGCLQPWPELGDAALEIHLRQLAAGEQSTLVKRALLCCAIDGEARRSGTSLFAGKMIPRSHATLTKFPDLESLTALAAEGFEVVKIKISRDSLPQLAAWERVPLKLRLDANGTLQPREFLEAMHGLRHEIRAAIDFVEDPCPFDAAVWNHLQQTSGVPLALDRGSGSSGFTVRIWKPACSEQPDWNGRLVVTSNMDHAVGQMFAAWEAACSETTEWCGLLTQGLFEEEEFFAELKSLGPQLPAPAGTGLGFDQQLEGLPWKRLS